MAWTELFDSTLKLVEKVLGDASLWFWLGTGAIVLLLADSRDLIPLTQAFSEPRVGLTIFLVVIASLWLNALSLHQPFGRLVSASRERIAKRLHRRKRNRLASTIRPGAQKTLEPLLRTRCRERRWFLWALSEDSGKLPTYGTILHDDEFAGARGLFELGLLHRTGDNDSAFVFIHKKIYATYRQTIAGDSELAAELKAEMGHVEDAGRAALTEPLPTYRTENFFRSRETENN